MSVCVYLLMCLYVYICVYGSSVCYIVCVYSQPVSTHKDTHSPPLALGGSPQTPHGSCPSDYSCPLLLSWTIAMVSPLLIGVDTAHSVTSSWSRSDLTNWSQITSLGTREIAQK